LSPEWVRNLSEAKDPGTTQLLIVAASGMNKTTAKVSMHERDEDGDWIQILSVDGYVGKNGMVKDSERKEGCGKTPIGVYYFTTAFGIADDPGCKIPYIKVTKDLYWSSDMREGMHYNELVSINDYPDLDKKNSEHLIDYTKAYQYCLNISFNEECTPGRGSAIFLHCTGNNKYTAGCVAVPKDTMVKIMKRVDPFCVVVIDTKDNLGA
jgi:L,D-peptidoglycan transpeptidase YkuD (ErfK/YbiS/YcfS/YnhG family)